MVYRNKNLSVVYYYSLTQLYRQINYSYSEISQWNVLEVKLKLLVFVFFVPVVMRKVQKVESPNIQSDCETTSKKRTDSSCAFTRSGKVQKGGER